MAQTLNFGDIDSEDLRVGHTIRVGGHDKAVVHIADYTHPTLDGAFGMAHLAGGATISLWHGQRLTVWL